MPQGGFVIRRILTASLGKKVVRFWSLIVPLVITFRPSFLYFGGLLKVKKAVPAASLEISISAFSAMTTSAPTAGGMTLRTSLPSSRSSGMSLVLIVGPKSVITKLALLASDDFVPVVVVATTRTLALLAHNLGTVQLKVRTPAAIAGLSGSKAIGIGNVVPPSVD